MVSGSKPDTGISARVKMTIQNIKEIFGNHSDADIYVALKEANMDPNETAQNLLQQDAFVEVKRRKDRKKEVLVEHKDFVDPRKPAEHVGQSIRPNLHSNQGARRGGYSYTRSRLPGMNRTYRVKENRVNQNASKETKPSALQSPTLNSEQVDANAIEKGFDDFRSSGNHHNHRQFVPRGSSPSGSGSARDVTNSNGTLGKEVLDGKQVVVSSAVSGSQVVKSSGPQLRSAPASSSVSVDGVYSSSSDPVHVPSPDSRSSGAVGAIKREVGAVGARRLPFENAAKDASVPANSSSESNIERGSSSDTFKPFSSISKSDQVSRTVVSDSVMPTVHGNRAFLNKQYASRLHHQVVSHPKAPQQIKEWKPKSSQKSNSSNPGVIGIPKKSNSLPNDGVRDVDKETAKLQDKLLEVNIHENENVIIAQHIRVPENDHCRFTFGSFGVEFDSSRNLVPEAAKAVVGADLTREPATSLSVSVPEASVDNAVGAKPADIQDNVQNNDYESPESGGESEVQLPDKKDTSSPQNMDSYADIALVQEISPSYTPSESQLRQDNPELQSFSSYGNQTGYDISYFRPAMDERGHGLPSPQESLVPHGVNGMPSSSISMVQQQQPPVATLYPQVHVPHFGGVMPYRPAVYSPFFLPQVMPGYSGNPAYAHPSNGGNFVIMPGGSSQLATNGLKYGIPQLKPVPAGTAAGFGNFANSTGYAINASGVIGNATGLEDSSRLKYKDGNLYLPNQQADTSDLWITNPRDLPGMQSGAYYNMAGQTPHGAYMPAHTGHTSFNAAATQSSHMQFQGLYHAPPQAGAMASPHHLGPAMGGNVGVGVAPAAPGAQVGSYQQPQLGHLNWTTNF